MPVAVLTLDEEMNILDINGRGVELLHTDESTVRGRNFESFVSGGYRDTIREYLAGLDSGTPKSSCELFILTDGSSNIFARIYAAIRRKTGDRPGGYILSVIDLSTTERTSRVVEIEKENLETLSRKKSNEASILQKTLAREISEHSDTFNRLVRIREEKSTILDSISELVFYYGMDMKLLWANRNAYKFLNIEDGDAKGRHYSEIWDLKGETSDDYPVSGVIQSGKSIRYYKTFDDGTHWFIRDYPVFHDGATVNGVVEVMLNITEQEKLKEALYQSETRYRSIVDDQTDMIYRMVPDGTITFANRSFCEYAGKSPGAIAGTSFREYIPETSLDAVNASLYSLTPESPVDSVEYISLQEDGKTGWQQWIIRALFNESDEIIEYQCVGRDITDLITITEMLKENNRRIEGILRATRDFIMLITSNGVIELINESASRMLNSSPENLIGTSYREHSSDELAKKVEMVLDTGDEVRFINSNAGRIFDTSLYPVYGPAGNVGQIAVFSRDITREKNLEREIIHLSEHERQKIGRDLHDGLGQQLTGQSYLIKSVMRNLDKEEHPMAETVKEIFDSNKESITMLRKISRDMMPVSLEKNNLIDALKLLLQEIQNIFHVTCEIHHSENTFMDSYIATHLYYIAREAFNNALKHANPDKIMVNFTIDSNRFRLTIENNINHVDKKSSEKTGKVSGIGLDIMEYRSNMINADFHVQRSNNRFTVEVAQRF